MFDLYFAGARNKVADDYMIEHGINRLQSQLIDRANISIWCKDKKEESKLFIDSGAYTAYTKGISVNVEGYIRYLNRYTGKFTIFAQVDKIPGRFREEKTKEDILNAPRLSWENYLYMRSKLEQPEKLLPIFHQGEDYKWLENMLEWRDENGNHIPYIGVSPAVDLPDMRDFLDKSFDIIKRSSNPNVKTHAFGMTRLDLLEMYPYTSADSTSWKLCAAMGSIYTPWGVVYVSSKGTDRSEHIKNKPAKALENILVYLKEVGYSLEEVASSDVARYVVNIKYLVEWAKNYKFRGVAVRQRRFL